MLKIYIGEHGHFEEYTTRKEITKFMKDFKYDHYENMLWEDESLFIEYTDGSRVCLGSCEDITKVKISNICQLVYSCEVYDLFYNAYPQMDEEMLRIGTEPNEYGEAADLEELSDEITIRRDGFETEIIKKTNNAYERIEEYDDYTYQIFKETKGTKESFDVFAYGSVIVSFNTLEEAKTYIEMDMLKNAENQIEYNCRQVEEAVISKLTELGYQCEKIEGNESFGVMSFKVLGVPKVRNFYLDFFLYKYKLLWTIIFENYTTMGDVISFCNHKKSSDVLQEFLEQLHEII